MNIRQGWALALCTLGATSALAADLNVGVSVGGQIQPGVYGQVNIGNTPPVLVYPQPVIIQRPAVVGAPIYMNVPPGHARKWSKHCAEYNACGVPVYFVRTREYESGYSRGYEYDRDRYDRRDDDHDRGDRGDRGERGDRGRGHGKGRDRD